MPFQTVSTDRHSGVLAPGALAPLRWRLHIVASADPQVAGAVLPLIVGTSTVGRGVEGLAGGLVIRDPRISRQHLALDIAEGGYEVQVRDLQSRHGVFRAGRPITQATVGDGAVLRFGDTVAVLECDAGDFADWDAPEPEVPGRSAGARAIRGQLAAAASACHPVLIQGLTGTGKEHAAALLHRWSGRPGPLVRVNVAAIPEHLFESALFGHVRGAFSGATQAHLGHAREAHRGTLVLDEIGELPLAVQPKLLRLLDGAAIRPLGGTADVHCDVQFVASTNADLQRWSLAGRFRHDLLARLRMRSVWLLPVASRRPDLLDLADAVCPAQGGGKWREALQPDAVEWLLLQAHADNLRGLMALLLELQALARQGPVSRARIERALARTATREAEAPPPAIAEPATGPRPPARRQPVTDKPDSGTLDGLLRHHNGNVEQVGQALGRGRRQVYRWLKYAGIDVNDLAKYRRTD